MNDFEHSPAAMRDPRRSAPLFLLVFLLVTVALRVFAAMQIPLSADEAYYFQWSEKLAFSYSDHPPLVAWLIRLGTIMVGPTSLGIRLMSIILGFAGSWIVYFLALELNLTKRHAVYCAILETVMLMPAVGALLMTPDVPLAFGWLLAALFLTRLFRTGRPRELYYLLIPLLFACYAKHMGFLLLPFTFCLLVFTPNCRSLLKTIHPWLALLIFVGAMSPWGYAEWQHQFPSIQHQFAHAGGALPGISTSLWQFPLRWLELLLGQFALLSPLVFIWSVIFIRNARQSDRRTYIPLLLLLLSPLAVTAIVAIFTHPEQNWASLGHPLAAVVTVTAIRTRSAGAKPYAWTLGSALLITLIAHLHAAAPFLPLPPQRDPITRLHGWNQLAILSEQLSQVDEIVCDNYGLAALVHWHLNRPTNRIRVVGQNRTFASPTPGDWLLLDEIHDYGNYRLSAKCKDKTSLLPIVVRQKRQTLHVVEITKGMTCTTAQSGNE